MSKNPVSMKQLPLPASANIGAAQAMDPRLVGFHLTAQFGISDAGANRPGIIATDGLEIISR